ncbi:hypothetical protein BUALT_Bualt14G0016600 [Buddleja alternifolia]|uniref:Uncharacterized protein n=1 Tax=Buddleja alternifolia TaxID=168488 RepID=A0AAV6WN57_9LAMI|nr:hypothetical protein BUALT_Bualt14G0016600 [Buddleja alternifolia]
MYLFEGLSEAVTFVSAALTVTISAVIVVVVSAELRTTVSAVVVVVSAGLRMTISAVAMVVVSAGLRTTISAVMVVGVGGFSGKGRVQDKQPIMANSARRSGNYNPSMWDHADLQSVTSAYQGGEYMQKAEKLKEDIRRLLMLDKTINDSILGQIEIVDDLERLGISYHFTYYIDKVMEKVYNMKNEWKESDLHVTALTFRLLRQHGYLVSPEIFSIFLDYEEGHFKSNISNDIKGLLSLYEASYLSMEGESIMDLARDLASYHLKQKLEKKQDLDQNLAAQITRSLDLPRHWRMLRMEARWFIEVYEMGPDMNPVLLEFAKLDFNMVQAMYQDELKQLSRWYANTCLAEKMSFARDRLVESFLWTIGFTYEPRFRYCRIMSVKLAILITIIDDIYDVYGTLDELELFTRAVERWDINELEQLPDYMKICFLALFNSMNELAYDVLKNQGFISISYLKTMWAELCKTYLIEARWVSSGYTPNLNEYLENGLISITGPLILGHAYFCFTNPIQEKALEDLKKLPALIRWTSLIARITDDLGTSTDEMKKGDVAKSIQCYMQESGCSEEIARNYVKHLIGLTWKKVNKETLTNRLHSKDFVDASINYVRVHHFMYQYGDGHGVPHMSKERIFSLILKPIN